MIGEIKKQNRANAATPCAIIGCYLNDGSPKTWRLSVPNNDDRWTKWWWLTCFGLRTWSVEERGVRIALGMTALAAFLVIHFPFAALLEFMIKPDYAAVLSGIASVLLASFAARPIGRMLFPDALRKADENSQRRLRRQAVRSTKLPKPMARSTRFRFGSTVLTSVFNGAPIGLATLFVLLVPIMPILLSLDAHVRQRAEDAVWTSVSGHPRPFAGPFPLIESAALAPVVVYRLRDNSH